MLFDVRRAQKLYRRLQPWLAIRCDEAYGHPDDAPAGARMLMEIEPGTGYAFTGPDGRECHMPPKRWWRRVRWHRWHEAEVLTGCWRPLAFWEFCQVYEDDLAHPLPSGLDAGGVPVPPRVHRAIQRAAAALRRNQELGLLPMDASAMVSIEEPAESSPDSPGPLRRLWHRLIGKVS